MLFISSSPFLLHLISYLLLVFVAMFTQMSSLHLPIQSDERANKRPNSASSSSFKFQPTNATSATNIPEIIDQESRNSNNELYETNQISRLNNMTKDYTQSSLNRSPRNELGQQSQSTNNNDNNNYNDNDSNNNQSDPIGLIPIVQIGSSNDKIPASRIIVCNDGPKILLFANGDIVTCYPSRQWQDKLWSDIKPSAYYYPFILANIIIFVVGTTGNVFVCLSVYRNHTLRNVTNYFIVNLALADFLVILICLPPTVIWDLTLTWFFGTFACKMVMYLQDVSVSVSVLTLTAISIDRYYAICYPLRFKSNLTKAKKIIAIIWLISFLIMSPDLIYLTTRQSKELYESGLDTVLYSDCNYNWSLQSSRIFQFEKTILLYFIPFLLMVVAHYNINKVLKVAQPNEMISIPDRGKQHRSCKRNYHYNNNNNNNNKSQHQQPIDHLKGEEDKSGRQKKKFMNKASAINHRELSGSKSAIPVLCVENENSGNTSEEIQQQQAPLLAQSENELNHHGSGSMVQMNCSINEYSSNATNATTRHGDIPTAQVKLDCVQKATNCNRKKDFTTIKQQCGHNSITQRNIHDVCSGSSPNDNKKDNSSITLLQQQNHSLMSDNPDSDIVDPSSAQRYEIDPFNFNQESSLFHQQNNSHSNTRGNYLVSKPNVPADQITFIDKADHSNYGDDDGKAGQVSRHLLLSMDDEKKKKIGSGETRTRKDNCCSHAPPLQSNIGPGSLLHQCGTTSERNGASKGGKEIEDKPKQDSRKTKLRLLNPTNGALNVQTIDRIIHENDNDDENELAASEYQIIGEHLSDKTVDSQAVSSSNEIDNKRDAELVCINQQVCSSCLTAPMARSIESEINDAPNSIIVGINSPLQPASPANKQSISSLGSSSSYDTIKLNSLNEKIKRRESSLSGKGILCCSGFCRSCSKSISQTPSVIHARTMNNDKSDVDNKSTNSKRSVDAVFCNNNRTIINSGDASCREAVFSSLSASSGDTSLSTADTDDNGVNQLIEKNVTATHLLLNEDNAGNALQTNSITEQSAYRRHHNQLIEGKCSTISNSTMNSDVITAPAKPPLACNLPMAEEWLKQHNSSVDAESSNDAVLSQKIEERRNFNNVYDPKRGDPSKNSNSCDTNTISCSTIEDQSLHNNENISSYHTPLPASQSSNKSVNLCDESLLKYNWKQSDDDHSGYTNNNRSNDNLQILVTDEEYNREKNLVQITEYVGTSDRNKIAQAGISAQEVYCSNSIQGNTSKQLYDSRESVFGPEPYDTMIRSTQSKNMCKKSSAASVNSEKSRSYDFDTKVTHQNMYKNDTDDCDVVHDKSSCPPATRQADKSSTINPGPSRSLACDVRKAHNKNSPVTKSIDSNDLSTNDTLIKDINEGNFSTSRNGYISSILHEHDSRDFVTNSTPLFGATTECSSLNQLDYPDSKGGCSIRNKRDNNTSNCHGANLFRNGDKTNEKTSLATRSSISEEELSFSKGVKCENWKQVQSIEKLAAQELAKCSSCDLKSCDKSVSQAPDTICKKSDNLSSASVIITGLLSPDILADNLTRDNNGKVIKSNIRSNSIATTSLSIDKATDTTAFLGPSNTGSILASMVPSINMHNKSKIQSRQKAAKMLMAIVIIFGVCFLPVHLINFLRHIVDDIPQTEITSTISMLSHCFCYLNSAINPIIYNYMNSVFRQEFKRFLSCLWFSSKPKRVSRPTDIKIRGCAKTGTTNKDGKLLNQNSRPIQTAGNATRQLSCLANNLHGDFYNEPIQAMTSSSTRSCQNNRKNTDCTTLSADICEMNKVQSIEV